MSKLTEADKRQIIIEYAAGASQRELSKKFSVSQPAIAKLLKEEKSYHPEEKLSPKSNKEFAHGIVKKAITALDNSSFEKMHPDTLLRIIERMKALYGEEEEYSQEVTEIKIEIEDASGDDTEDQDS